MKTAACGSAPLSFALSLRGLLRAQGPFRLEPGSPKAMVGWGGVGVACGRTLLMQLSWA